MQVPGLLGLGVKIPRPTHLASNCHKLTYDESCLAEKDRLRPWSGDMLKC